MGWVGLGCVWSGCGGRDGGRGRIRPPAPIRASGSCLAACPPAPSCTSQFRLRHEPLDERGSEPFSAQFGKEGMAEGTKEGRNEGAGEGGEQTGGRDGAAISGFAHIHVAYPHPQWRVVADGGACFFFVSPCPPPLVAGAAGARALPPSLHPSVEGRVAASRRSQRRPRTRQCRLHTADPRAGRCSRIPHRKRPSQFVTAEPARGTARESWRVPSWFLRPAMQLPMRRAPPVPPPRPCPPAPPAPPRTPRNVKRLISPPPPFSTKGRCALDVHRHAEPAR